MHSQSFRLIIRRPLRTFDPIISALQRKMSRFSLEICTNQSTLDITVSGTSEQWLHWQSLRDLILAVIQGFGYEFTLAPLTAQHY